MFLLKKELEEKKEEFLNQGIKLPKFDYEEVKKNTQNTPTWIHFGGGNIFRCFHAKIQQHLIDNGLADTGIIVVDTFDDEVVEKVYHDHDNLTLMCVTKADGTIEKEVIESVVESHFYSDQAPSSVARIKEVFKSPSLQIASLTITEKGYNLKNSSGEYLPIIKEDIENGPGHVKHGMSILASLLFERYESGLYPIALLSTDNFSHNGDKLKSSVCEIAKQWNNKGFVDKGFIEYLLNGNKVSFPWSMIDRITPRPSQAVAEKLKELGMESMDIIQTKKRSVSAPFVNTEETHYLVIEDDFPNGRPPFEKAGVYLTDKETVDQVERMKVCTCLNPLHTSMAIYGCLLGYTSIAEEMKDPEIKKLIEKVGYQEGLPVVTDPGIIEPKKFIDEVIEKRLPNKNIPDTPQRIVSDTSQKLAIRFGETIKLYKDQAKDLCYIPLVIAGWCRYLMGMDDEGKAMELSPDPLIEEFQQYISYLKLGEPDSVKEHLQPLLSNQSIFGVNLYSVGLGSKIEGYVTELIAGAGAVRTTLKKYLA
ncbi:mannitol dehydrogenase family protein [Heyndrickxia acidiproducens]|uniref:mannitol dehydrogenase family protein n=1 Tax=Heyndrickxia acidiproducens TaxID=1121084 RepID=UPI00037E7864|nr:mannitol dehydrogenase family protein [Heyndrickxia acidiproducens]